MKPKNMFVFLLLVGLLGCGESKNKVTSSSSISAQGTDSKLTEGTYTKFVEGVHYRRVPRLNRSREPQVIKFISYQCPACRFFESTSKLSVSDNVTLERFPVSFSREIWRQSAQAYATLRALNLHNELSLPLFQAIQDSKEDMGNKEYFSKWVSERTTLTAQKVSSVYEHDKVAELMAMYKAAERRYAITSVPSLYVNGNLQIILKNMEGESQLQKMVFLNDLVDYLILLHRKSG